MGRKDSLGIFWEDHAVVKVKAVAGKKPGAALPPPLEISWETGPYEHKEPPKHKPVVLIDKPQSVMDIECYVNFFLVKFSRLSDGAYVDFIQDETRQLDTAAIEDILDRHEIITFNGNNFDIPVLRLALQGADNATLKRACDDIIKHNLNRYAFEKKYQIDDDYKIDHIDLIELCIGVSSLKIYGGRLHCRRMQDLPISEGETLDAGAKYLISKYCGNDLEVTKILYAQLQPQINLRRDMSKEYRLDLRSKSDAQIAEEVIKAEIRRSTGRAPIKKPIKAHEFLYEKPEFIKFNSNVLRSAAQIIAQEPFKVDDKGSITMPKKLSDLKITIGGSTYQMGMGGLHSTERAGYHLTDDKHLIADWDVTSYYPAIILNCELYPDQLGKTFLEVYRALVEERLEAKAAGEKVKADALKIVVNGSFGKLGSPYSALFAPNLMVQVTVTGQLSLLMLIDSLESAGIPVVSANTDGIVIKCPVDLEQKMRDIISTWEERTGFTMENTMYRGIYSRDVNNYIAIKDNGEVKTKGCFSFGSLSKNPSNEICNIALVEYLKTGRPFKDTIESCRDITKFITVRSVNGGAVKDGKYLGKAIRWYYAKGEKGNIKYKTNDNQVARSEGAKPLMDLPDEFPEDIDYNWYVKEANDLF